MASPFQFFVSAFYVALAYACIGFGALIFRTIVDRLNIKDVKLGEELYMLYDPRAFVGLGTLAFFFCIFVAILVTRVQVMYEEVHVAATGVIFLVMPLVLLINIIQLYLRARWQRTSVRTQGILIRRLFSEKFFEVHFHNQLSQITIHRQSLWFTIEFADADHSQIGTCTVSAAGLRRILRSVSAATSSTIISDGFDLRLLH